MAELNPESKPKEQMYVNVFDYQSGQVKTMRMPKKVYDLVREYQQAPPKLTRKQRILKGFYRFFFRFLNQFILLFTRKKS